MPLIKDITLLILGGLITFIVMYSLYKIKERGQKRTPSLVWRKLPSILLKNVGLTALSLSIENVGTKVAKNVRVVISIPDNVTIESFEIETSESAMNYEIPETKDRNKIFINFPFFNKGLECVIAILAKKLDPSDIKLSIVGDDDVIGEEKQSDMEIFDRKFKRMDKIISLFFKFIIGFGAFSIIAYIFIIIVTFAYISTMDIADVYFQSGKYDLAIKEFRKVPLLFFIPPTRLYYELAKTHAMNGEEEKAIYYLRKVMKEDRDLAQFTTVDKSFDSIRESKQMKEFIAQFK